MTLSRKSKRVILVLSALLMSILLFALIGHKGEWPLWKYFPPIVVFFTSSCFAFWKYSNHLSESRTSLLDGKYLWLHLLSYLLFFFGVWYTGGKFGEELWRYFLGMAMIISWSFIQRYVNKKAFGNCGKDN